MSKTHHRSTHYKSRQEPVKAAEANGDDDGNTTKALKRRIFVDTDGWTTVHGRPYSGEYF
jgi:hypothetical protein